ncbi:MAG: glycerate kinase family protein [Acidimicrobiales bacterium]
MTTGPGTWFKILAMPHPKDRQPLVVAAPDKFRGTASAQEVAVAVAAAAAEAGWRCDEAPVADGGEGTLEALGGPNRTTSVRGPLGDRVEAEWRLDPTGTAVIEMARASGLMLAGGPERNDPIAATTFGTGELIAAAIESGARRMVVGVGGSATTDGGLGAINAIGARRLREVEVVVACDVGTPFLDAATVFGPQKGATPAQVALLTRRLERLAQIYMRDHGVDVKAIAGAGAAGGLAGGLAALGARLVAGFDVVAEAIGLDERVVEADLVVTGEGFLDRQSFAGKAVGGVVEVARVASADLPVLVIAGEVYWDEVGSAGVIPPGVELVSLVERFGRERAMTDAAGCVSAVVADRLAGLRTRS